MTTKAFQKDNSDSMFEAILGLLLIVPLSIFGAWGVSIIWGLFLVPAGLPALPVLAAWGFVACATLAAYNPGIGKDWGVIQLIVARVVQVIVALGIAYLVHSIFG
jgi:hypothetical protein